MSAALPSPWERLWSTPLHELLRGSLTGSLDWRQPISAAELPTSIEDTIVQTVRRAKLWRSERRAVAEELVAHFRDGLDAGATPEDLIASYGDPEIAARLIRGAKRRGRPLVWQAWWWGSRGALAAMVAYVLAALWLVMQRPSPTGWRLTHLNREVAPIDSPESAWSDYRAAFREMAKTAPPGSTEERPVWGFDDTDSFTVSSADLGADELGAVAAWLDRNQAALGHFRAASKKPSFGVALCPAEGSYPDDFREVFGLSGRVSTDLLDGWLYGILLPHVQASRDVGRVLRLDLERAAEAGESQRALENATAIFGVSRHADESPVLVSMLVGIAIRESLLYQPIESVLRTCPDLWSDDQLVELAHSISRPPRPLAYYLDGERTATLDTIDRVYSASGRPTAAGLRLLSQIADEAGALSLVRQRSLVSDAVISVSLPAAAAYFPSREQLVRRVDRFYRAAQVQAEQPLHVASASGEAFEHTTGPYAVFDRFLPAIDPSRQAYHRHNAKRLGAIVGIALELYHRSEGEWPETLAAMAPRWLPTAPIDPITDGPLSYRVVDGKPVVYSLGRDGDDDGGRLPYRMKLAESLEGGATTKDRRYPVGPPLTLAEQANRQEYPRDRYDGDWVLWSLAERTYMPPVEAAGFTPSE